MKLLHLGKYYPPFHGGMEYALQDLARAQQSAGHEVRVLVHHHRKGLPGSEDPIVAGEPRVIRSRLFGQLLFAPISPDWLNLLRRQIREFQPRLLHLHLPNPSALLALACPSARRLPWVVHWHSDVRTPQSTRGIRLAYPFYRPFEQALLNRAKAIVATSGPYLDTSPALAPHRERCHAVPLGIDPGRIRDREPVVAPVPRDSSKPFRVLAIGRLTYYKGFCHLLDAIAAVPGTQLTLIGEGNLRAALERQARQLGLGDRCSMPGNLDAEQLLRAIRDCHCLCLPSVERTEAFGLVLIEAMALGRPVIATRVVGSGMAWIVRDGENGLLVAPGNAAELAAAIQHLTSDEALRLQLARRGLEEFDRRFDIARVARSFDQIYEACQ